MHASHDRTARRLAALLAALAALAIASPTAGASTPPKPSGYDMHWYRWHPSTRALLGRTAAFGSTAVVGLASMHDLAALRKAYGFDLVRAVPPLHAAIVHVHGTRLRAMLLRAPRDRRVRYVSPLGPSRRPLAMPSDPLLAATDGPREWQFAAANVARALDFTTGSPAIVVGTIDSGTADVPDLAGKIDGRWTIAQDGTLTPTPSAEGNDDFGHGTAVASLIAANVDDGFGMAGFGGATHVISVRAGNFGIFNDASIAVALTKLVSLGVRIVNLSIGGPYPSEPILVDAVHKAAEDGVLLVAAVGNDGGRVSWPAADLQPDGGGRGFGLAVGASTASGELADFSNRGSHLSLLAPGSLDDTCSGVLVALPPTSAFDQSCFPSWTTGGGHYASVAGTSFAAPEVAGVAALVWAAHPELENYEVADIIKQSARRDGRGWTPTMGCGLLDAGAALELAAGRVTGDADGKVCSAAPGRSPRWPSEANQTITFAPLPNRTFGDRDFPVHATSSSGLVVSFTAIGNCTVKHAMVHLTGAGWCMITASQSGDASFNAGLGVVRTFLIAPAVKGLRCPPQRAKGRVRAALPHS